MKSSNYFLIFMIAVSALLLSCGAGNDNSSTIYPPGSDGEGNIITYNKTFKGIDYVIIASTQGGVSTINLTADSLAIERLKVNR
jgi:hypothetical protein